MPDIPRALLNSLGYTAGTFLGSLVTGAMILSCDPAGKIVFPIAWTLIVTFNWQVWSMAAILGIVALILALVMNFGTLGPKKKA